MDELLAAARELVDGPPGDDGECWYCGGRLEPIPGCHIHGEDAACYGYQFEGDHDDDCAMVALRDAVRAYDYYSSEQERRDLAYQHRGEVVEGSVEPIEPRRLEKGERA